ncbi:cellulose-binding domain-containing protein [Saccharophagus degradans]|uniref:cellulose-binding domain-containing protein n=1 Tax=Saccharophagus degradans TaxID=86304 RepID=UPI003F6024FB
MKLTSIKRLAITTLGAIVFASYSHAYDCSSTPMYTNTNPIALSDVYQTNNKAYECIANWCQWAEPEVHGSWAWAWNEVGQCAASGTFALTVSHPETAVVDSEFKITLETDAVNFTSPLSTPELSVSYQGNPTAGTEQPSSSGLTSASSSATSSSGSVQTAYNIKEYLYTASEAGDYIISVIWDADPSLNYEGVVRVIPEPETPQGKITVRHPTRLLVNNSYTFTANSFHPTSTAPLTLSFEYEDGTQTSSSSHGSGNSASSSTGGGGTYAFVSRDVSFSLDRDVKVIAQIAADPNPLYYEALIDIITLDDLSPSTKIVFPEAAIAGQTYTLQVQVRDTLNITSVTLEANGEPITATSVVGVPNSYGNIYSYTFTPDFDIYSLSARTETSSGEIYEDSAQWYIIHVERTECQQQGIDEDSFNAYPNWPQLDWNSNPWHADTGDLMSYQRKVYRANWWTLSVPGSDNSWEFVCNH